MPENNPTSWPPEPQTGQTETVKKPANHVAGWVSFGLAVPNFCLWVFYMIGNYLVDGARNSSFAEWFMNLGSKGPQPSLAGVAIDTGLFPFWVGAIVFGIIGRRSRGGVLGLVFAFLTLVAAYYTVMFALEHL